MIVSACSNYLSAVFEFLSHAFQSQLILLCSWFFLELETGRESQHHREKLMVNDQKWLDITACEISSLWKYDFHFPPP